MSFEAMSQLATPPTSPDSCSHASWNVPRNVIAFKASCAAFDTPPATPENSPLAAKTRPSPDHGACRDHDKDLELLSADLKLDSLIGEGLWSKVYRASRRPDDAAGKTQRCFAIKVACDRFSEKVLIEEQQILAFVHTLPRACQFVVPYYGWHGSLRGLVMDEIPLTLFDVLGHACGFHSTRDLTRLSDLVPLMCNLVSGLQFLHENCILHGDIKPHNILLRQRDRRIRAVSISTEPIAEHITCFEAYYCDFSASILLKPGEDTAKPHSAAGASYDYMAPELFSLVEPECYPSVFSDVYALGITLLSTYLGSSPFEGIPPGIMRRAVCKQGRVLEMVRERNEIDIGDTTWLVGALEREKDMRWRALEWQQILAARGWSDAL